MAVLTILLQKEEILLHRKKWRKKIKESEEKLSLLFNSMDEGFCIIEMIFDEEKKPVDYRFLVINPSFEKTNRTS